MIVTKENQKWLSETIDSALNLKGILEMVDGYAARILISVIDSTVEKKVSVPEDIKTALNSLIDSAKTGNITACEKIGADLLNARIDIPYVDEAGEQEIFVGAIHIIVGAVLRFVKK